MRIVLPQLTVKNITVLSDQDVTEGEYTNDWGPYRIEVETSEGIWVIEGCHDGGPDVSRPDGRMYEGD